MNVSNLTFIMASLNQHGSSQFFSFENAFVAFLFCLPEPGLFMQKSSLTIFFVWYVTAGFTGGFSRMTAW